MPQKTRNQNSWATGVWDAWANWHNKSVVGKAPPGEPYIFIPADIQGMAENELGFWLTRFVLEIRKRNGEVYPPNTMYQLCCGIQRVYNDRSI